MIRRLYQRKQSGYPIRVLFSGRSIFAVRDYAKARGCIEVATWRDSEILAFSKDGQRLIVIAWGPGVVALVNAAQHYKSQAPALRQGLTGAAVEV